MFFCVFSKFIKWPQLNCQAGQFQSLGRMFNTPGLLVHGVLNIRGPAWDFSPGPLMDFENKIIHGHFMFTKCFVKLYFVKYEDLSHVKTMGGKDYRLIFIGDNVMIVLVPAHQLYVAPEPESGPGFR